MRMRPREEYLVKVAPTLEDLPPDHPARIYAAGNVKVDDFIVAPLDDEFLLDSPHYHPINQSVWEVEHALPPYEKITPRPKMTGIYGRWPAAAFLVEDRMCFGAPAVFPYATLQKNGSLLLGACFRHQIMGHRQRCEHQDMVLPVINPRGVVATPRTSPEPVARGTRSASARLAQLGTDTKFIVKKPAQGNSTPKVAPPPPSQSVGEVQETKPSAVPPSQSQGQPVSPSTQTSVLPSPPSAPTMASAIASTTPAVPRSQCMPAPPRPPATASALAQQAAPPAAQVPQHQPTATPRPALPVAIRPAPPTTYGNGQPQAPYVNRQMTVRPNVAAVRPNGAAVRPNGAAVRPNGATVRPNVQTNGQYGARVAAPQPRPPSVPGSAIRPMPGLQQPSVARPTVAPPPPNPVTSPSEAVDYLLAHTIKLLNNTQTVHQTEKAGAKALRDENTTLKANNAALSTRLRELDAALAREQQNTANHTALTERVCELEAALAAEQQDKAACLEIVAKHSSGDFFGVGLIKATQQHGKPITKDYLLRLSQVAEKKRAKDEEDLAQLEAETALTPEIKDEEVPEIKEEPREAKRARLE